MTESGERPDDPPSYPRGGTYADLLHWHLDVWGTRPEGKRASGTLWTRGAFLFAFAGHLAAEDGPRRSLTNWLGDGAPPVSAANERILLVLFSTYPVFESWRIDLRLARDWSSKNNNKRTARAALDIAATRENVALIIDRLTEHFYGRADELAVIDKFVAERSPASSRLLVISAPPGFGKSALAAHWCKANAGKPRLKIVKHFCSTSSGATTTSPASIYAHLEQQLGGCLKSKHFRPTGRLDSLVDILKTPVPNNGTLVVWLDGIDQALAQIECFLPAKLGEGIFVIISACADDDNIPDYLRPWLTDAMAESHKPIRHFLQKLSTKDLAEMVLAELKARGVTGVPHISAIEDKTNEMVRLKALVGRVHRQFDEGNALFARHMTDTVVDSLMLGKPIRSNLNPHAQAGYVETELRRLEKLERWSDFLPLFIILVDSEWALSIDDLAAITGKAIYLSSIPDPVLRWLRITKQDQSQESPLLSFEHPLLAERFGKLLAHQRRPVWQAIHDNLISIPFNRWPSYALEHLPSKMLSAGHTSIAEGILNNPDFLMSRYQSLGEREFIATILGDWNSFLPPDFPHEKLYASEYDHSVPVRQIRFWNSGPIKALIRILADEAPYSI